MEIASIIWCFLVLFVNVQLSVGEPKRSFGFGRSRPKSNSNLSVRRRDPVDPPKTYQPSAPKQTQSHVASAPVGPPPAYSAGPSSGKTNLHAAPPAYSTHGAAPPSYSQATGLNHANYPRQNYGGVNSGANLHQTPHHQNYGNTPYNNYGNNGHYGGFPQAPSPHYGGMSPGYGAMPNYGGGMMGGGMMGGGMMGGGMMGGGMMGVQPLYVQQQRSSSPLGGMVGGALTGLAVYQLARAFGGNSNHHSSSQHIYHHYDQPQTNVQSAPTNQNAPAVNAQTPYAQTPYAGMPDAQTPNGQAPIGQTTIAQTPHYPLVPDVPLAPFPSDTPVVNQNCTENCTSESSVASTPVPEFDSEFPFAIIHPSLFPYASLTQQKELQYWAGSINRKLDLTGEPTASP